MLEKIGLPAKPSLRGNNWVVDASHCQGCSSQFTFINRKHHCRRCGGLFCGSCTQKRMVLRGQGDSPVRICEPCKTLEEAARFELRHGHKSRAGRGSSKPAAKNEDDILNQILGADVKESSSLRVTSNNDMTPSVARANSSSSSSNVHDRGGEIHRSQSVDQRMQNDMASSSPEELRQQAVEEKRKYKILKGEGKPGEALKAFKRGKELERQAESLEIYIRKNRKKSLSSSNISETQSKDAVSRKNKASTQVGKDDLAAELRELGWSDMDPHNEGKGSAAMSLEGELSSLLGEMPKKSGKHGTDKMEVVAIKKKALMLKREGKLAEAKEELKRAKVLEKQLEEQELLAGADDSDDELSAIINSMGNDKQDDMLVQYEHTEGFDFGQLLGTGDDIGIDDNFEVTDNDMDDPEIAAALKSLGWAEDSDPSEDIMPRSTPVNREALLNEILSLKREALSQKRAGNVAEAMAQLKKAKLLEKDLESYDSQAGNFTVHQNGPTPQSADISKKSVKLGDDNDLKPPRKSRLAVQKELLGLKKKALALRREGRLDEAEEELKKGKILEQQLEEMDNTSNTKAAQVTLKDEHHSLSETLPVEGDVTEQDLHDPTYLSILKNLGWNENDDELSNSLPKHSKQKDSEKVIQSSSTQSPPKIPVKASRRTKAEIQRELLGLKRKALSLRRQGNTDEAEEVLETAKALEAEIAEMEAPQKVVEPKWPNEKGVVEEADENVTENDMTDPAMLSMLKNLGWKGDEVEPVTKHEKHSSESLHSGCPSVIQPSSGMSASPPRSKREIERELLNLKRKALTLRRNGQAEEAEDLLEKAKSLESELAELEAPKEELVSDLSKDKDSKPTNAESFANHEKQGLSKNEVKGDFVSHISSLAKTDAPLSSLDLRTNNEDTDAKGRVVNREQKTHAIDASLGEGFASENNQDSLRQAVLSHKKKALALKRDGKLAEAREELRLAKLLEKSLTEDGTPPKADTNDGSISASSFPSDATKEKAASTLAPKPLSGRDRFKLQQESLSHKRQALKLRREGKLQEAEAEFEIAKSLEARLEESSGQDSTNTGGGKSDDVAVEDLLDPQLLSALKAIGLDGSSTIEHSPQRPEPVKHNIAKTDNVNQERILLEERIKAEKVKAVNLKRSGKQTEALDALRKAKMLEKKLNSLS